MLRDQKELWLVKKTLYGLVTSPRDWCDHRDGNDQEFPVRLREGRPVRVQATLLADIWQVQVADDQNAWTSKGSLATYVDDVLMVGPEEIIQGFIDQVKMHWKIGEPEWVREGREPVRFLGIFI